MKKTLGLIIGLQISLVSIGQINPVQNWCGTSHRMNDLMLDPVYQIVHLQDEQIRANEAANPTPQQKGTLYKVPIVFHIVHTGGPENTSEEQIYNALDVINRDFRKQNADTASVVTAFKSLIADVEIEFVLATKAPDQTCFKGYTRTYSSTTFSGGGNGGDAQVNAVRNGNDVYQGNWPSNKYLNVYVIADAGGAGGYTNYPSNFNLGDMSNGIWILHTQFGEIGTSGTSAGRSLTHECGHWFKLAHTWGSSNTPGTGNGNCSTDDDVNDTPLCEGASGGCPTAQVSCGTLDNVQNYMDYALSCQSMFTNGQSARMRTAIQSSIGGRNNLWKTANLNETGALGVMSLCKTDFSADKTSICTGTQVQFTDETYNASTGWQWTFAGGAPATSTGQNPTVIYNTPGTYAVTLVATDGATNDTETKTTFIHVVPAALDLPVLEGFEPYSTLNGLGEWLIINPAGNGFELGTVGLNSAKSARLVNYNQAAGDIDELVASPVDLSGVSQVTLSFRYAHKRRNTSDDDKLRVLISGTCGDSWAIRKTLLLSATSAVQGSSFTPASENDWTTVHVTNITSSYFVDNFRYKFTFEGGGGNNLYIDNINIYEGGPSDDLVDGTSGVGISELAEIVGLDIYPNPADNELNVGFNVKLSQKVEIVIQDLTGKTALKQQINAAEGSNLVVLNTQNLASGVYFMEIETNGSKEVRQFVVK
jgi:PKD repeat protein